jgi:hypothetical protein
LFEEKLIISINCEGLESEEGIEHKFWKRSYQTIKDSTEPLHLGLDFDRIESSPSFRQRTEDALEQLSKSLAEVPASRHCRFRYIVLVIDNLDRSPIIVQKAALSAVRDWMEFRSGITLWQIYIPLWPSTLDTLRLTEALLLPKEDRVEIQINCLDAEMVLKSRLTYLNQTVPKENRSQRLSF